jgi:hypothetical protein
LKLTRFVAQNKFNTGHVDFVFDLVSTLEEIREGISYGVIK